jgi:predicted outer membrane repeat protein
VVGTGTAASCTAAAVVAAVHEGGIITFACGSKPVTIAMTQTATVLNTTSEVVLDGGGLVTLSGEGQRRVLYMDTCDPAQGPAASDNCTNNPTPKLVVENLTFTGGSSIGQRYDATCPSDEIACASSAGGGGAIFANGGRLQIIDSVFTDNRCDQYGPDIGGGAVRALSPYDGLPVYVTGSRFVDNICSNGGALSSIGESWTVSGSVFTGNQAIGYGQNPAEPGTPGGGSGGAIYNDGDTMSLAISTSQFSANHANEGGGAIFFVSDDNTGTMAIAGSNLTNNPNDHFQSPGLPGIYYQSGPSPVITGSVIN